MTRFEYTLRWRAVLFLAIVFSVLALRGQTPDRPADTAAQVRILSPAEGTIVTGPTRLVASVVPADAASRAVFFVDGTQVCTMQTAPFECEWDAGASVGAHLVRLAVYLKGGGRIVQTARTRGIGFAEKVDVDVVQVTVTVSDGHGHYVKGLPRSAFHITENGQPQPISQFSSENVPLELVVAVDMSDSMTPSLPVVKKEVAEFLGAIPPRDSVTLLGFNDVVFVLARKTMDPAQRIKAVDALGSWGTTVLYDAIVRGTAMLGTQIGRKALVVFTDGDDQGSHVTFDEVKEQLQASDLTLYMIGQGRGLKTDPLKRVMGGLAEPTGGRAIFTERIGTLHDAFSQLLEELSNQYVLGYEPVNAARDGTWREITVRVDGYDRVRARKGYLAIADRD